MYILIGEQMRLKMLYIVMLVVISLSGFCSLTYQIVWERAIKNIFGGDAISSSIITATFILGMGIGAYLFRLRVNRSLRTYAVIELLIGVFGLSSYSIIHALSGQIIKLTNANDRYMLFCLIVVCIVCLLPPCLLIGGTLPLIFKSFQFNDIYSRSRTGMIYGVNTLGACIGILAVPLLFLNHISLTSTLNITGSINLCIAIMLFIADRLTADSARPDILETSDAGSNGISSSIISLCFMSGFVGLSIEITLLRTASVFWPSSAYNFPMILLCYLLALSIGSSVFARLDSFTDRSFHLRLSMLLLLSGAGIISGIFFRSSMTWDPNIAITLGQYAVLTFPFAIFHGAVFPLLLGKTSPTGAQLTSNTGTLYLYNSVGAFLGATLTQFIGYEYLGTKTILLMDYYIIVLAGLYFTAKLFSGRLPLLFVAVVMIFLPLTINEDNWSLYIFGETGQFEGVEGITGVASIKWNGKKSEGPVYVNNQQMSYLPDHPKHISLAIFPLSMTQRRKVLILGLGGGGMVHELTKDPMIQSIDVVDWSYELPKLLGGIHASTILEDVLHNPKVRLIKADARLAVRLINPGTYDVIVDNLSYPHWVGATDIKSEQYFREIARILTSGGTFVYDLNTSDVEVISGIIRNFRYVYLHKSEVLLATAQPVNVDIPSLERAVAGRKHVKELEITTPFYKEWLMDRLQLLPPQEFENIRPVHDNELFKEYYLRIF